MAELFVKQHRAILGLAKKSYLPDFSIGIFKQSLKEQPPFNANQFYGTAASGNWLVDVGISIPLWFSKGPRGEVQQAQSNLEIAKINQDAQNRHTSAAVTQAFQQIKAAEAQVQIFEQSLLNDIEDELQSGINLYRNNQLEALNLIEIYRTYVDTQIEYYRTLYNFNIAVVELEIAGEDRL
jgi:outer membrane protein TolC